MFWYNDHDLHEKASSSDNIYYIRSGVVGQYALTTQPHEPDISALLRLCDVHNIPLATNWKSAEILLQHCARPVRRPGKQKNPPQKLKGSKKEEEKRDVPSYSYQLLINYTYLSAVSRFNFFNLYLLGKPGH